MNRHLVVGAKIQCYDIALKPLLFQAQCPHQTSQHQKIPSRLKSSEFLSLKFFSELFCPGIAGELKTFVKPFLH